MEEDPTFTSPIYLLMEDDHVVNNILHSFHYWHNFKANLLIMPTTGVTFKHDFINVYPFGSNLGSIWTRFGALETHGGGVGSLVPYAYIYIYIYIYMYISI